MAILIRYILTLAPLQPSQLRCRASRVSIVQLFLQLSSLVRTILISSGLLANTRPCITQDLNCHLFPLSPVVEPTQLQLLHSRPFCIKFSQDKATRMIFWDLEAAITITAFTLVVLMIVQIILTLVKIVPCPVAVLVILCFLRVSLQYKTSVSLIICMVYNSRCFRCASLIIFYW